MSNPSDPSAGKFDARDDWLDIAGNEHIQYLDDKNFDEKIKANEKTMVMFYAPC